MRDFTLIFGCMFSGKTTKLVELYGNSEAMHNEKIAIKPLLDSRYNAGTINTHTGLQLPGHRVSKPDEIQTLVDDRIHEVYIDEVQFFSESIYNVILDLVLQGKKVVAAGLDKDYLGNPFGAMQRLKSFSSNQIYLLSKCAVCNLDAEYTFRKSADSELLLPGHSDIYEARCFTHWEAGEKEKGQP